jgi:hypothetical protein
VTRTFPEGFRWGAASAGHQTEGGNTGSDTWFLEHVRPTVFREPSGQACDSYELWREDVDLVAGLGLDAYRFSVEWARVEPAEGQFSAEALGHYRAIVDHCLALGIAPVVTYNHFTSPHWFARRGGWLDPGAPAVFARYCGVVTEHLGDGIAWAVTLNEPNLPRLLSWLDIPGAVRELERALEAKGVEVKYAIHPVAGRMPGHMNVLLAEADVPYDKLRDMEQINGEFANADVALVIGANDVVNPAARNDRGSPIYGMPILDVDQAKQVIVLKRSMNPGFAGIENELFYDPKTSMLFGDAKDSLTNLITEVKRA